METFSSFGALRESSGNHRTLKEIADILEGEIPSHTGGQFSFGKIVADKRLSEGTITCKGGLYHQESAICEKISSELIDKGFEVNYEGKLELTAKSPARSILISVSSNTTGRRSCCGAAEYKVQVRSTNSNN